MKPCNDEMVDPDRNRHVYAIAATVSIFGGGLFVSVHSTVRGMIDQIG